MTASTDNLILEHLKRFQAGQDRIESELREIKSRLTNLEIGQGTILSHIGHHATTLATQQAAFDRLGDRVERIERRLEIA